jgi:hypothetical protein
MNISPQNLNSPQYSSSVFKSAQVNAVSSSTELPPITKRGSATIVLLLGTSTAGKSTICNKVLEKSKPVGLMTSTKQEQNFVNFKINYDSKEWVVKADSETQTSGTSGDRKRVLTLEGEGAETRTVEIDLKDQTVKVDGETIDDPESSIKVTKLPVFTRDRDVLEGILLGTISDSPEGLQSTLQSQIQNFRPQMPSLKEQEYLMFESAMENSLRGVPTLIDIVPTEEGNATVIQRFENYLKEQGFSAPTMTIQAHLDLPKLKTRMLHRNATQSDKRDGLFPANQYSRMYGNTTSETHLGELKREDAESFIAEFGTKATEDQKKGLLEDLGFYEGVDTVNIGPKQLSDILVNTETPESVAEIAQDIVNRSTSQSTTPQGPHPFIQIERI